MRRKVNQIPIVKLFRAHSHQFSLIYAFTGFKGYELFDEKGFFKLKKRGYSIIAFAIFTVAHPHATLLRQFFTLGGGAAGLQTISRIREYSRNCKDQFFG